MILPDINTVCSYQFTTAFATLDGIYTLTEILSYNQAIADAVDFTTSLYTPAGLTTAQYATDAPGYQNDTVLYLTPVNAGGTAIYAPSSILATIPDPMVGCYNNLALGVVLGLFEDQAALSVIVNELNAIIAAVAGVSNAVKIYSLGTQYMRVVDYNALVAARKAAQSSYTTLYAQLQQQIALTTAAQNLNQYYQETLIALSTDQQTGGSN